MSLPHGRDDNLIRALWEDDQVVVRMLMRQLDSTAMSGEDGLFEVGPKSVKARAFFFRTGGGSWFLAAADDERGRSSAALPRAVSRLSEVRALIRCSHTWEQSLQRLDSTWDILPVDPRRKQTCP